MKNIDSIELRRKFQKKIAKKLKKCNIAEVAKDSGLTRTTLYDIKKKHTLPTLRTIDKLRKYFNSIND